MYFLFHIIIFKFYIQEFDRNSASKRMADCTKGLQRLDEEAARQGTGKADELLNNVSKLESPPSEVGDCAPCSVWAEAARGYGPVLVGTLRGAERRILRPAMHPGTGEAKAGRKIGLAKAAIR